MELLGFNCFFGIIVFVQTTAIVLFFCLLGVCMFGVMFLGFM